MYLAFYGLKTEPFRLTPDPRFFMLAEPHRHALTALLQGILRRKGLMVITGPIGTGKTTVLNAMLMLGKKLPQQNIVTALLVNPLLNREEFLEALLEELEITCPSTSRPQRLLALYRLFRQTQQSGGTTVLVFDEAHLLSAELLEEIRLMFNMDSHQEQLVQVVLCGQPELASTLLDPTLKALRQRIAIMTQLRGLTFEESRRYMAERLHYAGLTGAFPFTEPAILDLHYATQGVPRLINLVCDNAMVLGFNKGSRQIGADIVREAIAELSLIVPAAASGGKASESFVSTQ